MEEITNGVTRIYDTAGKVGGSPYDGAVFQLLMGLILGALIFGVWRVMVADKAAKEERESQLKRWEKDREDRERHARELTAAIEGIEQRFSIIYAGSE